MRLPSQRRSYGLGISITPLIDLVFLLNIFFLVATYFIRNEQVQAVDLPLASQGRDDSSDVPGRLTVTLTAEGELSVSGQPITVAEFEAYLRETFAEHGPGATEVRLRVDQSAPYADVEPLLLKCAELGVTKIRFSVLQRAGN